MTGIPAIKSKIAIPQLPASIVVSDRIKKLADAIRRKNAVIIAAPSGYGKTTLMMYALASCKGKKTRICWYRLEQEDKEPAVFYSYLIETLFPREDEQWEEIRSTLDGFAEHRSQYRYINAIICQELWAFYEKNRDMKSFIVFDDFQNVMDSPEISETIAYFISNLPENYTALVSSRRQTGLLTEKHKLESRFAEINETDLCFSEKEIGELLKKTYRTEAGSELMRKIGRSTEGWIAGIIMICQNISGSGTAETGSLLEKPWQKTVLFRYMASEVLKNVDAEMMLFLVKISMLKDFTVECAEEILDMKNAELFLSRCERMGLFIQKTIRENITYRFHSLFRDALLQLQTGYLSDEEIKNLNLKAAAYYIEHKIFDRAIEHFIVCGDIHSAVELVTRESIEFLAFEAVEQLRVWFNLLPEEVVEQNPSLLFIKSYTYHQGNSMQPMILMENAFKKFKEKNDTIMQVYALMTLTNYSMITNRVDNALEYVSQALEVLRPYERKMKNRTMSRSFLFLRALCEEKYSRAVVFSGYLTKCEMPDEWKWGALVFSSMLGYVIGDLDFAENAIKKAFELNLIKRTELFRGYALTGHCDVLYLKNDITALKAIEADLMAIGQKYDFNYILGLGRRASAYGKYAAHDLEGALEQLDSSINNFERHGNTAMVSINKLCRLLWLSREKSTKELLRGAEAAFRKLASTRPGFCLKEIGMSLFGAIARECKEYKLAEEYLLASVKASEAKGAKQILCGACLHLAKLHFDTGEKAMAEDFLKRAFSIASENRYSMFWDIHLTTLTEMSVYCMKAGIYGDYAEELIQKYFKQEAVVYIRKNIGRIDENSIRDFSEKILLKYCTINDPLFSYTVDIHLFGKFRIAVNGTVIPDDEWKTRKIKGILEYLVLHRGVPVTREQLMEIFWPDSDKRNAAMSLSAALYALKKVLAKYGIGNEEYALLIHEQASSLEIKPNPMIFVDADEFLQLHQDYKNKKESDGKQKLEMLERMNALYAGSLLEEEIYADWTFVDREWFKSIYLETVVTLASLYVEDKEMNMAERLLLKALHLDPYNEEICLGLLKMYISSNQRSRAVKLYSDFEKRLKKELNINPDERLSSLFADIIIQQ